MTGVLASGPNIMDWITAFGTGCGAHDVDISYATGPERVTALRSIGRCHAPHHAVLGLARTGVPGAYRGAGTTLRRALPSAFVL